MNKVRAIAITLVLTALLNTGCHQPVKPVSDLYQLDIGMTKEQVDEAVGKPYRMAGTVQTKYGQTVRVLEYKFRVRWDEEYWLCFVDGLLVSFGESGDWGTVSHSLQDTDFGKAGSE